jgi:N-acetylglucosamine kinase-like BadF-type ATPase
MTQIFMGVDIGSSTSHAILIDERGSLLGNGAAGPGNHEVVGYDGLRDTLQDVTQEVLRDAGVVKEQISGAGFGVSGYDWPSERVPTMNAVRTLELSAHLEVVNDTLLGLIAGAEEGWGIAVVAGSGENCWGRDTQGKIGRMTGNGPLMGEYGGASTLVMKAIQAVSAEWAHRGPPTALTKVFLELTGASDIADLLEGLALEHYRVDISAAPRIFHAAADGDLVAHEVIHWAGEQLGLLANGVIRQLNFQNTAFDVVEVGGLFKGGSLLTDPLHATVHELAPDARFVPLKVPPVVGAALLAMEHTDLDPRAARLALSAETYRF